MKQRERNRSSVDLKNLITFHIGQNELLVPFEWGQEEKID